MSGLKLEAGNIAVFSASFFYEILSHRQTLLVILYRYFLMNLSFLPGFSQITTSLPVISYSIGEVIFKAPESVQVLILLFYHYNAVF